jgi:hypothetical protein
MTPPAIIKEAMADGVTLALSAAGTIKATGNGDAVNRWLPAIREHKPGIMAALQEAANEATAWRWLLHYPDREPVEVRFSPEATHAEALAAYPEAIAAEPIPETPKRPATDPEAAELRSLVSKVYAGDTEADRAEALAHALSDPEAALICYRSTSPC